MIDPAKTRSRVSPAAAAATLLALSTALLASSRAGGDDTRLLREPSGKPYVQVILDTSSSMNLSSLLRAAPQDPPVWLPLGADDPRSMFHDVKSALAEVLDRAYREHGDFAHFGLVTLDQNHLRVRGKHWLYSATGNGGVEIGAETYPVAGEELTFGAHLPTTAGPGDLPIPAPGQLGSCQQPIPFSERRAAVNRFPKLHPVDTTLDGYMEGMEATSIWLAESGSTYELVVSQSTAAGSLLGADPLSVDLRLNTWSHDCSAITGSSTANVSFETPRQFFIHDLVDEGELGVGAGLSEADGGVWLYRDAEATGRCGAGPHPHTGRGWEGNYDSGTLYEPPGELSNADPFCVPPGSGECDSLKHPTVLHPNTLDPTQPIEWRTLDAGDLLPLDWEHGQREPLLRRLAPNWTPGASVAELDFGLAPYFRDVPDEIGFLELVEPTRRPLVPLGASGLIEALTDWRCHYLGSDEGGAECGSAVQPFGRGFDWLASGHDLEWGCRRPRLLIITDGENNCTAEDPAAATPLLAEHGIEAWVVNLGPPDSGLEALAAGTGGIYLESADPEALTAALEELVGDLVEENRAFATAVAAPVDAGEEETVVVADFHPLDGASVWPGEVRAFLKPVPLDAEGRPAVDEECGGAPGSGPEAGCLIWSAGTEILTQVVPDLEQQLGPLPTQRRIYYSRLTQGGDWPNTRRFLAPTSSGMPAADLVRYDLWRALGLIPADVADGSLDPATETLLEAEANGALAAMMALESDDNGTPGDPTDDSPYILGDIFHSRPLIVGAPANSRYFALDLHDDGTECESGNPSYRCFFRKHRNRRRVVLVGSNDAQVHAIDGGIYRTSGPYAGGRDRGSGRELFAFTPRAVLPAVHQMFGDALARTWTVDGSSRAVDVFIDPIDEGGGFPVATQREWRTVVVGGLRRGGETYFALDVTQPDRYDADGAPAGIDDYVPTCLEGGDGCGPLPYPSQLWEFSDSWLLSDPAREVPFDTDGDGADDLTGTWSTPSLGLIRLCTGSSCDPSEPDSDVEHRFVAVFGGGLDKSNATGNWLYMVDVETGEAIYKRELLDIDGSSGGAVPSEVAAVDTDDDGFLDRVYTPTLRGFVYRTDLYGPGGEVPRLEPVVETVDTGAGNVLQVEVQRITGDDHRPHLVFKAQPDAATAGPTSRAIYYRPSVIYSAALGQHVLAVGTGDREDLWTDDGSRGAFYVFRDDIPADDPVTFYTEQDLVGIDSEADGDHDDLLTDPSLASKGWYLQLRPGERLIGDPMAIAGVLVFTVFDPDVEAGAIGCTYAGQSRVFGVTTTSGNGILFSEGERLRALTIADFLTEPWVEPASTANSGSEGSGEIGEGGPNADDLDPDHLKIFGELAKLLPSNCKFANHRLDVKALSSDTGVRLIAPIPICIIEKNWKEL